MARGHGGEDAEGIGVMSWGARSYWWDLWSVRGLMLGVYVKVPTALRKKSAPKDAAFRGTLTAIG